MARARNKEEFFLSALAQYKTDPNVLTLTGALSSSRLIFLVVIH